MPLRNAIGFGAFGGMNGRFDDGVVAAAGLGGDDALRRMTMPGGRGGGAFGNPLGFVGSEATVVGAGRTGAGWSGAVMIRRPSSSNCTDSAGTVGKGVGVVAFGAGGVRRGGNPPTIYAASSITLPL